MSTEKGYVRCVIIVLSASSADKSSAVRGFLSRAVDADYTVQPESHVEHITRIHVFVEFVTSRYGSRFCSLLHGIMAGHIVGNDTPLKQLSRT